MSFSSYAIFWMLIVSLNMKSSWTESTPSWYFLAPFIDLLDIRINDGIFWLKNLKEEEDILLVSLLSVWFLDGWSECPWQTGDWVAAAATAAGRDEGGTSQ